MSGLIFGKYEVVRRLAVGGMGEVFLARQVGVPGFERKVILKSLLPDHAEDPILVEQFLDEARLAALLNHPNVVSIYEVGLWGASYYLAMEFIEGWNLAEILREAERAQVKIPPAVTARIIHDAALGLFHAHEAKDNDGGSLHLVHRDVTPHNIMVRPDDVTKVVDFGIARAANRSTRTATGTVKGKVRYLSPEQARGEPLDARSDQFSLAVVMWEMCVGRRLFGGDSDWKTLQEIGGTAPIPDATQVSADVPSELSRVIQRALSRDRAGRYSSCELMAQDLQRYFTAHPAAQRVGDFCRGLMMKAVGPATSPPQENTPSGERKTAAVPIPLSPTGVTAAKDLPRILYVEDEPDNFQIAELRLRRKFNIVWAKSDREACELLRSQGSTFYAVLLDVELKGSQLDGLALLRLMRGTDLGALPDYARGMPKLDLPVLVVTAYGDRFPEREVLALGATYYIPKPIDFIKLSLSLASANIRALEGSLGQRHV